MVVANCCLLLESSSLSPCRCCCRCCCCPSSSSASRWSLLVLVLCPPRVLSHCCLYLLQPTGYPFASALPDRLEKRAAGKVDASEVALQSSAEHPFASASPRRLEKRAAGEVDAAEDALQVSTPQSPATMKLPSSRSSPVACCCCGWCRWWVGMSAAATLLPLRTPLTRLPRHEARRKMGIDPRLGGLALGVQDFDLQLDFSTGSLPFASQS